MDDILIQITYFDTRQIEKLSRKDIIAKLMTDYDFTPEDLRQPSQTAEELVDNANIKGLQVFDIINKLNALSNFETSLSYIQSRLFAESFSKYFKNKAISHIAFLIA